MSMSIKFKHEFIPQLLDGSKTQTRRPLKPQPEDDDGLLYRGGVFFSPEAINAGNDNSHPCPYGRPGDRLWVQNPMPARGDIKCWLEVTSVRVERLQSITMDDAVDEGIALSSLCQYVAPYAWSWDTIYKAKGLGWGVNPWVWVLEFKRAER